MSLIRIFNSKNINYLYYLIGEGFAKLLIFLSIRFFTNYFDKISFGKLTLFWISIPIPTPRLPSSAPDALPPSFQKQQQHTWGWGLGEIDNLDIGFELKTSYCAFKLFFHIRNSKLDFNSMLDCCVNIQYNLKF